MEIGKWYEIKKCSTSYDSTYLIRLPNHILLKTYDYDTNCGVDDTGVSVSLSTTVTKFTLEEFPESEAIKLINI